MPRVEFPTAARACVRVKRRTRAAVEDALRGYKEIHLRALKLLKPGGTLVYSTCSMEPEENDEVVRRVE